MGSDIPEPRAVKQDRTPWLLLVPVVALDALLFAAMHLNQTLWQWGLYALSRFAPIQ